MQAFAFVRFQAMADDQLGGAAADIHHQPLVGRGRQRVRHPQIDQPCLFAPGDDFNRVAQRGFGPGNEGVCVPGDAQRRGADAADRLGRQPAQALAKAVQTGQRAFLCGFIELLVVAQSAGQAHGFLQRIEWIELVAGHPGNFEAERIGAEVDGGEGVVGFRIHAMLPKKR